MLRLNNRAYRVLHTEIRKCTSNEPLSQVEQKLVLEELEKLRSQPGSPATLEELRKLVITTYPKFSEKALSAAAKANCSLGVWGQIRLVVLVLIGTTVVLVGTGGAIGLGIILLASENSESIASNASDSTTFASMSSEEHFQSATVLVEQVEQLVNKVTTPTELVSCENKLNEAKKHLDELPVSDTVSSSSGTYSRRSKRRSKRRYSQQTIYYDQSASNDPSDQFASIRSRYEQMQAQVNELKSDKARTVSLIKGAQEFAFAAAKSGQNPPHSAARWQEIESLWQKAIDRLEEVPVGNSDYVEAQKLLATYQTNRGTVETRRQVEQESVEALEQANSQIEDLVASIPSDAASMDRNSTISQIQEIINQLKKVQNGTTAYPRAQELLLSAQNKLNQL
jgi:uncharacterized Zn finger protein (UPF0148 family)